MLKETPLTNVHRELGGKIVDFSSWLMPVNYGSQVEEHHAVRQDAGMFDVSHMTIVDVSGEDATPYLRKLLANDVSRLDGFGSALYSAMLTPQGGVIDDLIVYQMEEGYRLVVNCATREKDLNWMQEHSEPYQVRIVERPQLAMIAVQGPKARVKFHDLVSADDVKLLESLPSFKGAYLKQKPLWFVARTGYTGEDGYEIMLPSEHAEALWRDLLSVGVRACGLGARDTLRLEAGMNLYGHEMNEDVSPLAANMAWTLSFGEGRDFIGAKALLLEKETGVKNKLAGLIMQSRGVLREGYTVGIPESERLGVITSGTFSPTLGCSIALARVPMEIGAQASVSIRGKNVPVDVVRPCFVRYGEPI